MSQASQDISLEQLLSVIGDLEVNRRRLEVENKQLRNELSQNQNGQASSVSPSEILPRD